MQNSFRKIGKIIFFRGKFFIGNHFFLIVILHFYFYHDLSYHFGFTRDASDKYGPAILTMRKQVFFCIFLKLVLI